MSKAHRGTPLKNETPRSGRGTCPVTGRTGVKLLYEVELDGKKTMVSKAGKATLANIKKRQEKEGRKAQAAATPAPTAAEEPAPVAQESAEPAAAEETTAEDAGADSAKAEDATVEGAGEEDAKAEEATAEESSQETAKEA